MAGSPPEAVFARVASLPIPRVLRMMSVARELGYDVVFCGAFREPDLAASERWCGWEIVRLGRFYPLLGGRRPLSYLRGFFAYNRACYRFLKARRPELVHASDVETMPAAMLYRLRHGTRLVYNIHDNLAQRYSVPRFLAAMLNGIEGLCVRAADVALVPETFRRAALPAWCRGRVEVIRNTPEDRGFAEPDPPSGTIRIFYAGWLDPGRGLRALLELVAANPDFELRLAGEGAPEVVAELRDRPRVTCLGFLDHETVMEETRRSHFVAALYDPARPINRYAASNKLAEALSVGRPVLLNSELEVARSLPGGDCFVMTDYASAAEAGPRLRALAADPEAYRAACRAAREIYERDYAWPPVRAAMERVLAPEGGAP